MNIGFYIKKLRIDKGYSQEQLGKLVGVQRAAVQKWECGKVQNLKRETIKKLAEVFNVPASSFFSDFETEIFSIPGIQPIPKIKRVPRLGAIACGEPILAEQNIDGYDTIEADINCDFTLVCKGDSMINARIFDGDVVYIKQQPDVENGEIAAVLINDEATLKKVYKYPDKLVLRACNPLYDDFVYTADEATNIHILGKAVIFKSLVRHSK